MSDGLWSRRGRGIVDYIINLKMNLKKNDSIGDCRVVFVIKHIH